MNRAPSGWLFVAALGLGGCSDSRAGFGGALGETGGTSVAAEDPSDFGVVPGFELVSETGSTVHLADLTGRPFVAAAIFTTCYGPCPRITSGMHRLQEELADTDVRFVSVSVDPEHDTPEVLGAYAKEAGADPERWLFLTGERGSVERFLCEGLWLGVERAKSGEAVLGDSITHSTRLVAVDREGRLRGWYDGEDPLELERLRDRMRFLSREGR